MNIVSLNTVDTIFINYFFFFAFCGLSLKLFFNDIIITTEVWSRTIVATLCTVDVTKQCDWLSLIYKIMPSKLSELNSEDGIVCKILKCSFSSEIHFINFTYVPIPAAVWKLSRPVLMNTFFLDFPGVQMTATVGLF